MRAKAPGSCGPTRRPLKKWGGADRRIHPLPGCPFRAPRPWLRLAYAVMKTAARLTPRQKVLQYYDELMLRQEG